MKNKLNIIAIIPARMNSTRFPGKPLAKINGKPMIGHVYERVAQSKSLNSTVVATCDQEIIDYINSVGGMSVMTSAKHERASDRCAEALIVLEKLNHTKYDIVVMVQGDEPLVKPEMIDEAVLPMLQDCNVNVVNLLGKIKDEIASTGIDFEDDAVFDSLIKFTTQDEKKLGVGMGELALALLFKNIGAATKKGDLTLDDEEFEIKGYGAKLGRDPSGFQVKADSPFLKDLGLVKLEKGTKENPGNRDIMKVGNKTKQLNSLSDVLSDLYDVVPDKEKFVEAFKNMLKDKNAYLRSN